MSRVKMEKNVITSVHGKLKKLPPDQIPRFSEDIWEKAPIAESGDHHFLNCKDENVPGYLVSEATYALVRYCLSSDAEYAFTKALSGVRRYDYLHMSKGRLKWHEADTKLSLITPDLSDRCIHTAIELCSYIPYVKGNVDTEIYKKTPSNITLSHVRRMVGRALAVSEMYEFTGYDLEIPNSSFLPPISDSDDKDIEIVRPTVPFLSDSIIWDFVVDSRFMEKRAAELFISLLLVRRFGIVSDEISAIGIGCLREDITRILFLDDVPDRDIARIEHDILGYDNV